MTDPPFETGAVQVTVLFAFSLEVPETDVGAPGTVEGVAGSLGVEDTLEPLAFLAVTVNVYDVPFVNPVTTKGEDESVVKNPPGLDVTV